MPEYKYSTGWDSYDYGGCKCIQMEFVETEIDKLSNSIIPNVLDLKIGYNGIYYMYADLVSTTEKALYIKEDRVSEIQNEISDNESSNISDILSCIRQLHLCLDAKEIKLDRLEEIDKNYHDDYDN